MRTVAIAAGVCLFMTGRCLAQNSATVETRFEMRIPPQSLETALTEFTRVDHIHVLYLTADVNRLRTLGVSGYLTADEILTRLLSGTGLSYRYVDDSTVSIFRVKSGSDTTPVPARRQNGNIRAQPVPHRSSGSMHQAYPDNVTRTLDQPSVGTGRSPAMDYSTVKLEEVTVTGTHIHNAEGSVLPTQTFTRESVVQTGLGTVSAFLQTLPENFAGGMSETTDAGVAGGGQSGQNESAGTGVNLRGLGDDATLVLLDGHRIAPAALFGNFTDVAMIPLSAVERVDVVTDGASAIYGSDAVGGVVNIISRHGLDGVETRARVGSDTHHDVRETEIGQTIGRSWTSGSALASYEYYDRTPLSAAERTFTEATPLPFTLLPEQVRNSAFATLSESPTSGLDLYSDAYFSHRSTNNYATVLKAFRNYMWSTVDSYGAILGGRLAIGEASSLDVSGDYSVGDTAVQGFRLPQMSTPISNQKGKSTLASGDAVLSGGLWSLAAGRVLYALGVQYRSEAFDARNFVAKTGFHPSRTVAAGFAELRLPLLGSRNPADQRGSSLEVSLADREERYSDFGSTNNDTVGVLWGPIKSLKLRGTYGTSFVAPLLSELNPTPSEIAGFNTSQVPGSAPVGSGVVNELIIFGGNANLRPQKATTWTIGADWNAEQRDGITAHLGYFNIVFGHRINALQSAGYNVYLALPLASTLGPQIVQTSPSPALVGQLAQSPALDNFGANLSDIGAVIDARELNLSQVNTDGIDVNVADRIRVGGVIVEPGFNATELLHLSTRFTNSAPVAEILNTIYNPTRTRVRGHVLIARGPISMAGFVNFVNSYSDIATRPSSRIASWTTIDLSVQYSWDDWGGLLRGFRVNLGVLNLLNRAPPYAKNGNGFAVDYDGTNASPLGRFLSLDVTTRW